MLGTLAKDCRMVGVLERNPISVDRQKTISQSHGLRFVLLV